MIVVLQKDTREILGVAETIAEARDLRAGKETIVEIVGDYQPRIAR